MRTNFHSPRKITAAGVTCAQKKNIFLRIAIDMNENIIYIQFAMGGKN
jgi:hypothetical protein